MIEDSEEATSAFFVINEGPNYTNHDQYTRVNYQKSTQKHFNCSASKHGKMLLLTVANEAGTPMSASR